MTRNTFPFLVAALVAAGLAWQQPGTRNTQDMPVSEEAAVDTAPALPAAGTVLAPAVPAAQPEPAQELRLAGFIDTGASRRALIAVDGGAANAYAAGDRVVGSIDLAAIGRDGVTLREGAVRWDLHLAQR